MKKQVVAIKEDGKWWKLRYVGTEAPDEWYHTAADALQAVKEYGKILSEARLSSVITIEWEPITKIGRWVVRALQ